MTGNLPIFFKTKKSEKCNLKDDLFSEVLIHLHQFCDTLSFGVEITPKTIGLHNCFVVLLMGGS